MVNWKHEVAYQISVERPRTESVYDTEKRKMVKRTPPIKVMVYIFVDDHLYAVQDAYSDVIRLNNAKKISQKMINNFSLGLKNGIIAYDFASRKFELVT